MFAAFAQARRVQEWRQLLASAAVLKLRMTLERRRLALAGQLLPAGAWAVGALAQAASGSMNAEMAEFLRDLRSVVTPSA